MTMRPGYVAAGENEAPSPIYVRAVLRRMWEADRYPILGNEDRGVAEAMENEARDLAAKALLSLHDPPEFAGWLAGLRNPRLPNDQRDAIMEALYELFDPDTVKG